MTHSQSTGNTIERDIQAALDANDYQKLAEDRDSFGRLTARYLATGDLWGANLMAGHFASADKAIEELFKRRNEAMQAVTV